MLPSEIVVGRVYHNRLGTVARQVLEFMELPDQSDKDGVKYVVRKSHTKRKAPGTNATGYIGVCTRTRFVQWAGGVLKP